ncbi:MAG: hypothetical protein RIS47_1357 [Bacteroidota bacterium]|jgi:AcrR family transcriptional regulator
MIDKQELIFETALRLFVSSGFHGTPTSLIAKEAGVANGTLFHYFATKEELIVALYVKLKREMTLHLAETAQEGPTLKETLKSQFLCSLFWALDHKDAFKYIEQFNSSPYMAMVSAEIIAEQLACILGVLRTGIESHQLSKMPEDLMLSMVGSHVYGLNRYLISANCPKATQHQIISDSFEMLWKMLT